MAISTVKATVNGVTTTLTLNTSTGKYEATITAPSTTSWFETDHKYNVTIEAKDTAGNTTTVDRTDPTLGSVLQLRVLENVGPSIAAVYPTMDSYITNPQPEIKFDILDAGSGVDASTIKIKVDTGSYVDVDSTEAITGGIRAHYTPTTVLTDGVHALTFKAKDNDGNDSGEYGITFTVDTVAPTLTVTTPTEGLITNNATCTVTGTTSDTTSSPVTVKVNGVAATVTSGAFSKNITLTEGANTITVVATDLAGKSTTVERHVTLDTTPPVITAVTITPNPVGTSQTYVISVSVTDA